MKYPGKDKKKKETYRPKDKEWARMKRKLHEQQAQERLKE